MLGNLAERIKERSAATSATLQTEVHFCRMPDPVYIFKIHIIQYHPFNRHRLLRKIRRRLAK
jgi:hypothetical protein